MTKESEIELIAGRIMDEFRKHGSSIPDWHLIAAKKIHSEWSEFYIMQINDLKSRLNNPNPF